MSELFNAPYGASNQKVLRSVFGNRKLADTIIEAIYDLQAYSAGHGGTITQWVMSAPITVSSSTAYVIDSVKIKRQLEAALYSDYIAGRMLNAIREMQILASIAPIISAACTYKRAPSKASILRTLIASLANKKMGKLIQSAINELQVQFTAGLPPVPAVAAQFSGQVAGMTTDVTIDADVAGIAGNVTLVAAPLTDIDALIAAHNLAFPANTLTLSVGDGTQIPTANIVLSGGADAYPNALTEEFFV
jgi:hypothetical protein